MPPRRTLLFAVATGAAVANLYYAQPLLEAIASSLHCSRGAAGLLVTCAQLGYAAGLLLLVPLGDLLERRGLICGLLVVSSLALAGAAAAPSLAVLGAAIALVGVTSVVAQVLVPLAGDLASEDERGRVVGVVMSGLLLGILVARTVAGLVAEVGGWRAIFVVAAVLMLVLAALLRRLLPELPAPSSEPYGALLRSVGTLVRREPLVRRRMAYGFCGFGTFTVLWTALTFLLSDPPYRYGEATIGLFGLAGLLGAGVAQVAGRLGDRGLTLPATGAFWAICALGWLLCLAGERALVPLVLGLVVVDAGVQGQHILSQHAIYAISDGARSRVTTAYVTTIFAGGAIGSALAGVVHDAAGWKGVCALGGGYAVLALGIWVHERLTTTDAAFDTSSPGVEPR